MLGYFDVTDCYCVRSQLFAMKLIDYVDATVEKSIISDFIRLCLAIYVPWQIQFVQYLNKSLLLFVNEY